MLQYINFSPFVACSQILFLKPLAMQKMSEITIRGEVFFYILIYAIMQLIQEKNGKFELSIKSCHHISF